jgi:hypothetical protein
MSQGGLSEHVKALREEVLPYLESRFELTQVELVHRASRIAFLVSTVAAVAVILTIGLTLASIGLAVIIGRSLGHLYQGFLVVGAGYAVLALLVYLLRKPLLSMPITNFVVWIVFSPDNEEDENDED